MPLAGLVVNRASPAPERRAVGRRGDGGVRAAAQAATRTSLTAGLLRLHADRARLVEREALLRDAVRRGAPDGADGGGAGAGRRRARPRRACAGSASCSPATAEPIARQARAARAAIGVGRSVRR